MAVLPSYLLPVHYCLVGSSVQGPGIFRLPVSMGSSHVSRIQITSTIPMMIHIRRMADCGSEFLFFGSSGLGSGWSQRQQISRSSGLYTPQLGQSIQISAVLCAQYPSGNCWRVFGNTQFSRIPKRPTRILGSTLIISENRPGVYLTGCRVIAIGGLGLSLYAK
jgi:hypothetical protein